VIHEHLLHDHGGTPPGHQPVTRRTKHSHDPDDPHPEGVTNVDSKPNGIIWTYRID
jgi:hypothetical protein